MFDEDKYNDSDLQMRSILSDAQEEVPTHIWDGISAELDRMDSARSGKAVVLWLRRFAVAVAAAAVLAVGIFTNHGGNNQTLVPEVAGTDMIAVIQPEETVEASQLPVYMAEVRKPTEKIRIVTIPETEDLQPKPAPSVTAPVETSTIEKEESSESNTERKTIAEEIWSEKEFIEDDWEEERTKNRKAKTSIVISGITGTNSIQNNNNNGLLRFPSISTIRPKTGIKQTKEESSYGLPLSVGAGVKIGLAPRWSLGVGLNYTLLTRKFYGYYTHVDNEGNIEVSPSSDIRNSQHYIGIPVNAYYDIVSRDDLNFYAYAGGTVERCISDKYDVIGQNIIHTEKTKGMQLSANIGIGVEFILGKHLGLYIDPSLRYYFNGRQPKSIRTAQPLMMGFEMGLRVNL